MKAGSGLRLLSDWQTNTLLGDDYTGAFLSRSQCDETPELWGEACVSGKIKV